MPSDSERRNLVTLATAGLVGDTDAASWAPALALVFFGVRCNVPDVPDIIDMGRPFRCSVLLFDDIRRFALLSTAKEEEEDAAGSLSACARHGTVRLGKS